MTLKGSMRFQRLPALCSLTLLPLFFSTLAHARPLDLHRVRLDLPGAPATVVAADVNADGRLDLTVVVAYTERGEIGIEESSHMEGIEGLVEVLTVVPALLDRREVRVFLGDGRGGFAPSGEPLALEPSVLSLEAGPPGSPIVVLTDEGVSALRLSPEGAFSLEPLIASRPLIAGSGAFVPRLGLAQDVDGDGVRDFLLPKADGLEIYLAPGGALAAQPVAEMVLPLDARLPGKAFQYQRGLVRHYPLPLVADFDGDRRPDLWVRDHLKGWNDFQVLKGLGGGRFAAARSPLGGRSRDAEPEATFAGDLDGDGVAEWVTEEEISTNPEGMRAELKEAKQPRYKLRVHGFAGGTVSAEPLQTFEVEGYSSGGEDEEIPVPGGFEDLNGDGRLDLVAVNLDFSLFEAVKILTVKRLTLGLDFNLYCQKADGSFVRVPNLDLSGEFKINLDNLRLGQVNLFADFDGDGKADFVQLGRGKTVSIHRGRDDCSYATKPDLTLTLDEPPQDLALVRLEDLDGDGRADLAITRAQKNADAETTAPVELDLYLSGGAK